LADRIVAIAITRLIAHPIPTNITDGIIPKRCVDRVAATCGCVAVNRIEPPVVSPTRRRPIRQAPSSEAQDYAGPPATRAITVSSVVRARNELGQFV